MVTLVPIALAGCRISRVDDPDPPLPDAGAADAARLDASADAAIPDGATDPDAGLPPPTLAAVTPGSPARSCRRR
ncbi:MAG TPA: hypothetical protein RMH99_17480 [Sandaracinaceae bacterium LLY-WYZ-13_1]|nr:hypothetical protein [Sandaracinaceae bacterium LLY-WYZ-13_1]